MFNSFEKFNNGEYTFNDYLKRNLEIRKQAKEMEKEQILDAHIKGHNAPSSTLKHYDAEQYYNETYNNKNNEL